MKQNLALGAAAAVAIMIAVPTLVNASPEFLAYEGRNAIQEGQGGEKKIVNGVEFWFNGDPPHRFKVLGAIRDRRMKTGIYGMIRMGGLDVDIANAAKAAGGDAVILANEDDDLIGVSGFGSAYASGSRWSASAFGSSFSAPVKAHVSRYIVVKYLPDDPTAVDPISATAQTLTPTPSASPPPEVSEPTPPR